MDTLYIICAAGGGTIFVAQLLMSLFGAAADHDFTADHGDIVGHEAHFWGVFSLRAIVAGVTAFGLGGLAARSIAPGASVTAPIAIGSALVAMLIVAAALKMLSKLTDDGTTKVENSVGAPGVVYISIPGEKNGLGKVHLQLQNRTVELDAVTYGNSLDTGTRVVVTSVIAPGTVEVIAAPEMGKQYVTHESSRGG